MQILKRGLTLLTLLSLLLLAISGCNKADIRMSGSTQNSSDLSSSENGEHIAMGRYIETPLDLPEAVSNHNERFMTALTNPVGELEVYSCGNNLGSTGYSRYTLRKKEWVHETFHWGTELPVDYTISDKLTYGADGKLYAVLQQLEGQGDNLDMIYLIAQLGDDSSVRQIPIEYLRTKDSSGYYPQLSNYTVLRSGAIAILCNNRSGLLFDSNGNQLMEFDQSYISLITSAGSDIITINQDYNRILMINSETGRKNNEIPIEVEYRSPLDVNLAFCPNNGISFYVADEKGIYYVEKDGSVMQTLVEGSLTTLGAPAYTVKQLLHGSNDCFYIVYHDFDNEPLLYKYEYSPDTPTLPGNVLTIYSMEESDYIKQTIHEFQQKYPEFQVNYVIAKSEDNNLTTQDYVKALNSEILSENAADIIVTDHLPEASYIDKGIFIDISDVIDPLVESDDLYGNIVDCYRRNGRIYTLPMKVAPTVYVGNKEVLEVADSLSNLLEYASTHDDLPLLAQDLPYEQVLRSYYQLYSPELVDDQGNVIKDNLSKFLSYIRRLSSSYSYQYSSLDDIRSIIYLANKGAQLANIDLANQEVLSYVATTMKDPQLNCISSKSMFRPCIKIGINNRSNYIKESKAFLKILLSTKVQRLNLGEGLAINKKAVHTWEADSLNEIHITSSIGFATPGYQMDAYWPLSSEVYEALEDIMEQLNTPVMYDETLYQIIEKELLYYLHGIKTVNQITKDIAEEANLQIVE